MRRTYVFRLYPTRAQSEEMEEQLRLHRNLYNAALAHRRWAYKQAKVNVTFFQQCAELKDIRGDDPAFAALNSHSCQATLRRLDRAFQAFFRRVKAGEKAGYPRFKSADRFHSIIFTSAHDGCVLHDDRVTIQHVGVVKVKLHRPVDGQVKTLTITKRASGWYLNVSCDLGEATVEPSTNPAVGIDLGLHSFIATSDGEIVDAPQFYRKAQKKLRRAQRQVSRRKRGSNRRRKAKQRVARLHEHVANSRKDFQHKTALNLVKRYGTIAVEDLNVKGLAGSMLAKSVHDVAWGQFLDILAYKAESAGVQVVRVDARNTTQACSGCGILVPKSLKVRTHCCPDCGLVADRDVNAALNIKRLGLSRQALTLGLPDVA